MERQIELGIQYSRTTLRDMEFRKKRPAPNLPANRRALEVDHDIQYQFSSIRDFGYI